jgi:hypothetical protein
VSFSEKAPELLEVLVVGGQNVFQADEGWELPDRLMLGKEPCGRFDDSFLVDVGEVEFLDEVRAHAEQ